MPVVRSLFARLWPLALFVATAALMIHNAWIDPYGPTLTGTASYGHNPEGALPRMLLLALAELLVLWVVLAPGAANAPAWRAAAALLLFAPWAVLGVMMTMHAGGIITLHALWLIAVVIAVVVVLAARLLRRARSR